MESVTVATILESVGTVFTSAMGWAGTVINTIVGNPLLLIGAVIGLCGIGIGFAKRLMR